MTFFTLRIRSNIATKAAKPWRKQQRQPLLTSLVSFLSRLFVSGQNPPSLLSKARSSGRVEKEKSTPSEYAMPSKIGISSSKQSKQSEKTIVAKSSLLAEAQSHGRVPDSGPAVKSSPRLKKSITEDVVLAMIQISQHYQGSRQSPTSSSFPALSPSSLLRGAVYYLYIRPVLATIWIFGGWTIWRRTTMPSLHNISRQANQVHRTRSLNGKVTPRFLVALFVCFFAASATVAAAAAALVFQPTI